MTQSLTMMCECRHVSIHGKDSALFSRNFLHSPQKLSSLIIKQCIKRHMSLWCWPNHTIDTNPNCTTSIYSCSTYMSKERNYIFCLVLHYIGFYFLGNNLWMGMLTCASGIEIGIKLLADLKLKRCKKWEYRIFEVKPHAISHKSTVFH